MLKLLTHGLLLSGVIQRLSPQACGDGQKRGRAAEDPRDPAVYYFGFYSRVI